MADSGTYTPESIQRRFQIAQQLLDQGKTQPVRHWAEGLNELAKGAAGNYQFRRAEDMELKSKYDSAKAMADILGLPPPAAPAPTQSPFSRIASLFTGGDTGASSTAMPGQAGPPAAPPPATPTPLPPPPTPVQTVGANQPSPLDTAQWPAGPVGKPGGAMPPPGSPTARVAAAFGDAGAPTFLPRAPAPSTPKVWGDQEAERAGLYDKPPGAGALPPTAAPAAAVMPQAAPQPTPGPGDDRTPFGSMPESKRRMIGALLANPGTQAMGQMLLADAVKKDKDNFIPLTDPAKRAAAGIGPKDESPYQVDLNTGKVSPINTAPVTNVALNTALKGKEAMATHAAKAFDEAQTVGRDATKRTQVWNEMERAAKGFVPGATADIKLTAKRYLKDLGVISGEDVPDAEVFKQMQQQIALHSQPKGQGAVSNVERELFAKAIPNMTMSPEALTRAIQISKNLDEFDRKVAQIYRASARKNDGVPDQVEIHDEIEKLGAPIGTRDRNYLNNLAENKGASTASTPAAAVPDRSAIEAEMKRRGLK